MMHAFNAAKLWRLCPNSYLVTQPPIHSRSRECPACGGDSICRQLTLFYFTTF